MSSLVGRNLLAGPEPDVAADAGHADPPPRMGFFTDTSVCIGCKACEVACKEWNGVPEDGLDFTGMSYDNTRGLGATPGATSRSSSRTSRSATPSRESTTPAPPGPAPRDMRWLMASDVCKHCTHAACLDVCPTGSLFRTEFGTVVVQEDICNGCGYCVPACPYGVIDQRQGDGRAWKCTLCYDRLGAGASRPAPRRARPTRSSSGRSTSCANAPRCASSNCTTSASRTPACTAHDPDDGVGGDGAFFLLLDEPEVYGLPPDPVVTTRDLPAIWQNGGGGRLRRSPPLAAAGSKGADDERRRHRDGVRARPAARPSRVARRAG